VGAVRVTLQVPGQADYAVEFQIDPFIDADVTVFSCFVVKRPEDGTVLFVQPRWEPTQVISKLPLAERPLAAVGRYL
jgi:hypothetical protein